MLWISILDSFDSESQQYFVFILPDFIDLHANK